jgi:DnaK suppressor protein
MVQKKSLMEKAMAAAKKAISKKPAAKKAISKKPAAKKAISKKPAAKKAISKKPAANRLKTFKAYNPRTNERYMNKTQTKHFKKVLNDWKLELGHDTDRTVSHMQTDVTAYADPNDRASQESDMALELRNRDRERKLLKKIDDTLKNIDEDEYGYCNGCGEEIGLKRLQARPTATLCIDCKTLEEIKEKQLA